MLIGFFAQSFQAWRDAQGITSDATPAEWRRFARSKHDRMRGRFRPLE